MHRASDAERHDHQDGSRPVKWWTLIRPFSLIGSWTQSPTRSLETALRACERLVFRARASIAVLTYAIAARSSLGSPPSGSLIRAIDSKVK